MNFSNPLSNPNNQPSGSHSEEQELLNGRAKVIDISSELSMAARITMHTRHERSQQTASFIAQHEAEQNDVVDNIVDLDAARLAREARETLNQIGYEDVKEASNF